MKPIAMAVFMLALGAGMAEAQVVKYVDSSGVVHYVGSETQIPEQYRARAEALKLPEPAIAVGHTVRLLKQATQQQNQVTERAEAADNAGDEQAQEVADTAHEVDGAREQDRSK